MSEIDSMHGDNSHAFLILIQMMKELGYDNKFHDRNDGQSASIVFYNREILSLAACRHIPFNTKDNEFIILCFFICKQNEDLMLVFGQTALNDGPNPGSKRLNQVQVMESILADICRGN